MVANVSAPAADPLKSATLARVAVIVPAYGVADLLGEALESLQRQTEPNWECIVIDDGAPDDVAGAVAPYLRDPRIRFVSTANHGVSAARNRAIRETRAPLVVLLDADDLLRPGYLKLMAGTLEADPAARIATCNARVFGAVTHETLVVSARQGTGDGVRGSLSDVLDRSFNVYIGTTFRRADFDAVDGFDETMSHAEDFDLWVRLMLLGGHALYVNEVLGEYRVRNASASASGARMLRGSIQAYDKALERLGDGPEAAVARDMRQRARAALDLDDAIGRIAAGETAALPDLRATLPAPMSPLWTLAFALWALVPALAPPMLRWRQRGHARGSSDRLVPALDAPNAVS